MRPLRNVGVFTKHSSDRPKTTAGITRIQHAGLKTAQVWVEWACYDHCVHIIVCSGKPMRHSHKKKLHSWNVCLNLWIFVCIKTVQTLIWGRTCGSSPEPFPNATFKSRWMIFNVPFHASLKPSRKGVPKRTTWNRTICSRPKLSCGRSITAATVLPRSST